MYQWSTFLLFALISASTVPAVQIDAALAREEKRQVSLSTGVTSELSSLSSVVPTTPATPSPSDAPADTTIVVTESFTSTGQGSTVIEQITSVIAPTVEASTTVVQSTITRTSTNAEGQTTQVAEPTSVTATTQITYSFSQVTTSAVSQVVETFTSVQGGSTVTGTRTSQTTVPVTSSVRVTPTGIASGSSSGGSSGLSASSKRIIGGVVGGIGGALLIGALAFTAWRIWGKKKNVHDEDLYDPNANTEKLSTSTDFQNQNQPFRSTLDQYHQPGPVNTASNF